MAFLAGFFDAEGSIYLHRKVGERLAPEVSLTNANDALLRTIAAKLCELGYSPKLQHEKQRHERAGITGDGEKWRVVLWRHHEVQRFLSEAKVRHPEKKAKTRLVLRHPYSPSATERTRLATGWTKLTKEIKEDRVRFLLEAKMKLQNRSSSA